ncbi:RNA-binding domain-containing protein [Bifidobacterium vespertilionis]|uniref:AAA family ATPase n=1 Tax=Bifidobacterium vespertilionis TaxID=2562524 RepID=A0A5J5DWG5_9BIFI|nr:RNA-binding domain-containing protein [Bifidobacterium vespertilionis]KAA8821012.1 AAA family ATPase [Bifidobacterium vespertilionis]KAA8821184.1 AAA family ATPase [Bifidobacterium vespertilionis]
MASAWAEGPRVEFKRDWVAGAKRTAVAFANTDGGTIWLGVDDDGRTVGLENRDESMRQAMQAVSDGIRPDLMGFVSVEPVERDGLPVAAVRVQRGANRPYYLADKGIRPAGVYVRSGAASIPAQESMIVDMVRQSSGGSFEPAVSLDQDLTFRSAGRAFRDAGVAFTDASMRTLRLTDPQGRYTNLGLLLSDQCPAQIRAAAFAGPGKGEFLDRQEFSGSLFLQLDQAAAFVSQHNRVRSTIAGLRRVDEYEYTPLTLREALLNMIIHRDYALTAPALVSVFPDRMEFLNPGGLPDSFTRADMLNGVSCQRNPGLADVFYRLRYVEAYGTGIRRMLDDYAGSGAQPGFNISDHAFRLVLPVRRPDAVGGGGTGARAALAPGSVESGVVAPGGGRGDGPAPAGERDRVILELAKERGTVTRAEAQAALGVSQATVARLLRALVDGGLLEREGRGPATRYLPRTGSDGRAG